MNENSNIENIKYLDNLPKPLDDQQKAACCKDGNVIVAAGAGSGKTQVLATRFAWLVMSKNIPAEKILTLTFTKKAASEMYQRIYQTLDILSKHPDTPKTENARAVKALSDFSRTHIQTLDSYMASVLKQCASSYGIRPDFVQGGGDYETLALNYVMKNRKSKAVQDLINIKNFGNLQEIAKQVNDEIQSRTSLASESDYFKNLCERKKAGCKKDWGDLLEDVCKKADKITDTYNQLSRTTPKADSLNQSVLSLLDYLDGKISDNLLQITLADFENFSKFVDTLDFSLPGGRQSDEVKGYFELIKEIRPGDKDTPLSKMLKVSDYMQNYENEYCYATFLDDFLQVVNEEKRTTGQLTFKDISEMAVKALKEQDDLRTQEQNAFDRIMIDEFQDNNDKNRELLFLLSSKNGTSADDCCGGKNLEESKLFFVGDDKQSIYKFRGADVSVFKQLGKYLNTEPINMVYNYRSTQELLDSFNLIFGGYDKEENKICSDEISIFPETVEDDATYIATFTKSQIAKKNKAVRKEEKPTFKNSPIHFCYYNGDFSEENEKIKSVVAPYETELRRMGRKCDFSSAKDYAFMSDQDQMCYFIANEIRERISFATEKGEKLCFSDFAILDKSRGARNTLVKYLSYFDIPYNLDQQTDVFETEPVNDIYNLLRLCIYPSDRLALASFLCSPFSGLLESEIESLFVLEAWDFSDVSDDGLKKVSDILDNEKFKLYKNAQTFFLDLKSKASSSPLSKTITELWYDYGYRYETLWHKNMFAANGAYDLLFELARQCDTNGTSLSTLVDELDKLKSIFRKKDSNIDVAELEFPKEMNDAVQVMTIHKSKGLQFKYIFVLGAIGSARGDYSENDENVSEDSPFGEPASLETAKADAEFRRVIYVALTRAEKEAYIVGHYYKNIKNCSMLVFARNFYPQLDNPDYALGEYSFENNAPFDYISIMPVDRNSIYNGKKDEVKATLKVKGDFMRENANHYEKANVITLESQMGKNPLTSPSSMEKSYEECEEPREKNPPLCPELDSILEKLSEEKDFKANHFGTFAHSFMENYVGWLKENGEQDLNADDGWKDIIENLPISVFRKLWDYTKTEDENYSAPLTSKMISSCKTMCEEFEKSQFAEDLKQAEKVRTEYAFVASQDDMIVNGVIDLCYKMPDGRVVIVDYKTDGEIQPDKYDAQLACYKKAASSLFGVGEEKIECWLYFLRYGQSVKSGF